MADKVSPAALHLPFRAAVGAFVENAVQPVGTEIFIDDDMVLLLPCKIVKVERGAKRFVKLVHGFFGDFVRSKQAGNVRRNLNLALLQAVIKRVAGERALGMYADNRHAQLLQQNAHAARQRRCAAIEGIARLRVHQHA